MERNQRRRIIDIGNFSRGRNRKACTRLDILDRETQPGLGHRARAGRTRRFCERRLGRLLACLDSRPHGCVDRETPGVGTHLLQEARDESSKAGYEWLHGDFEEPLAALYMDACGSEESSAGLLNLKERG